MEGNPPAGRASTTQWSLWLLIAGMGLIAAALMVVQIAADGFATPEPRLLLLLPMFAVAEISVVHLPTRKSALSHTLRGVPAIVGLAFLSPGGYFIAYLAGTSVALALASQRGVKLLFNLAMYSLDAAVALLVYRWVLGSGAVTDARGWAAALAAVVVTDGVSAVAVTVAISMSADRFETGVLRDAATVGLAAALVDTCMGLLCVVLITTKPAALPLLGVVLLMLTYAYRAYISLGTGYSRLQLLYRFVDSARAPNTLDASIAGLLTDARDLLRAESAELIVLARGDEPGTRTMLSDTSAASTVIYDRPDGERDAWWAPAVLGESVLRPHVSAAARRGRRAHGPDRVLGGSYGSVRDGIAAPLRTDGQVDAVMLVINRTFEAETFSAEDLLLFETLAAHASVALGKARLVDRLRRVADQRDHEAHHDALTLLPNRQAFQKAVTDAVAAGGAAAVMLLDLNDFKDVNDTLGHGAGDRLLCEIGLRLETAFGGSVARLGGDEFAILLTDISDADAKEAALALLESIALPVLLQDVTLSVSASLGVAMLPRDGTDSDELLQHADAAMYKAKAARTGVEMYRSEDVRAVHRRVALAGDLPRAVHEHDFTLAYQLQAEATTGRIVAVEALMRWAHPTYGAVPPPEVVALADRTGMLRHLTDAVLMDALNQRAAWVALGHQLTISVNVTARDLSDANLPSLVDSLLQATDTPPSALTLEITESGVMKDPARCMRVLDELAEMKVQLSVDDFGTGYSSLAYLERLPVNEVKIDKSFVQRLERKASDSTVVRATIALAHDLGMRVVAEGIESQAAWSRVAGYGCDFVQGYWIARPMPGPQVATWLQNTSESAGGFLPSRRPNAPLPAGLDQS